MTFDLHAHLAHQFAWSAQTFGPPRGVAGVLDHIRQELNEIEDAPHDIEEWIDVLILAFDGAFRAGATPKEIIEMLQYKQAKNEKRVWPDWRTAEPGKAINHVKGEGLPN